MELEYKNYPEGEDVITTINFTEEGTKLKYFLKFTEIRVKSLEEAAETATYVSFRSA